MAPSGWTITSCGCGSCWDSYPPEVRQRAAARAIDHMWAATGRQFGKSLITVQPCHRRELLPEYQTFPVEWDGYQGGAYISGGVWHNDCSGTDESTCSCSPDGRCSVLLAGTTTTADIVSVTLSGVVLAAGNYVVVNGNTLIRTDGECWPSCPSLSGSASPEFEVSYLVGREIPDSVQYAAELLACEYAKACTGAQCGVRTRPKTISRTGTDIEFETFPDDPGSLLTGIRAIDSVINTYNPKGLMRRPTIMSPDMALPRRAW